MSSRSLNKVMLIGNLTRDPELRYTPSGTPVCTFGLATNRSWTPADGGERKEETEFHRIVAWHKLAELCSQLLFKGRKAFVEGRLQSRSWTSREGQERQTTEVVIDNMIILDSRRKPGEEMPYGAQNSYPAVSEVKPVDTASAEEIKKKPDTVKADKVKKEKKAGKKEVKEQDKVEEEVKADDIPF